MKLSVIVCAMNAERTIEDCLKSVKANNPSEIIIIHGKCADNTLKIAKKYTNKLFFDKGKSLAYARQLGARKAEESLISYTDADTVVPNNCYARMIEEMKIKNWVGIHAQIVSPKNNNYLEWGEDTHFQALFNNPGPRHRIGTIVTVWDKSKVLEHGFDAFMGRTAEDLDICVRLTKAGHVVGVSDVKAFHRHRTNFKSFAKQKFQYGKGSARAGVKHRTPWYFVTWILSVPYGFLGVFRKKGLFTAVKMLPYYFLNAFFSGVGVFYESVHLLF